MLLCLYNSNTHILQLGCNLASQVNPINLKIAIMGFCSSKEVVVRSTRLTRSTRSTHSTHSAMDDVNHNLIHQMRPIRCKSCGCKENRCMQCSKSFCLDCSWILKTEYPKYCDECKFMMCSMCTDNIFKNYKLCCLCNSKICNKCVIKKYFKTYCKDCVTKKCKNCDSMLTFSSLKCMNINCDGAFCPNCIKDNGMCIKCEHYKKCDNCLKYSHFNKTCLTCDNIICLQCNTTYCITCRVDIILRNNGITRSVNT